MDTEDGNPEATFVGAEVGKFEIKLVIALTPGGETGKLVGS